MFVYQPPDSLIKWFDHFTEIYDSAHVENEEFSLMGDTNLDFLKPEEVPHRCYKTMDS